MKSKKENEIRRNRQNLATANLADSYIKKLLKADGLLKGCEIPPELIEAKREHLLILRLTRQLNQAIKDRQKV